MGPPWRDGSCVKKVAVGCRWEEPRRRPEGIRFEMERKSNGNGLQLIRKVPGETRTKGRIAQRGRESERNSAQKLLLSSAADKSLDA